jgi:hypothetical protein
MNIEQSIFQKGNIPNQQKQLPSKKFWLFYGAIVLLTLAGLWWLTRDEELLNPSREEALKHNYYLFVLPETTIASYGWEERISLVRWENTCHFIDAEERYNPLNLRYDSENSDSFFIISVDPWNSSWSDGGTDELPSQKPWIPSNTMTSFQRMNSSKTKTKFFFADHVGNPVYIISTLSSTETLGLVNSLELITPEGNPQANPWHCP